MDSKERAALIREGNAAFNDADYPKARELYLKCDYKDGLIRLGDYYMYEKKLPILAYGYYKKAGHTQKMPLELGLAWINLKSKKLRLRMTSLYRLTTSPCILS